MKKLIIIAALIGASFTMNAQESKPEYKIEGNKVVRIEQPKQASKAVKTELTTTIKGKVYPVFKSSRGAYYIERISAKSGKTYKQYLKIESNK